jgi:hypothetical protein
VGESKTGKARSVVFFAFEFKIVGDSVDTTA